MSGRHPRPPNTKQTTLYLDKDLWARVKAQAAMNDVTLRDVMTRLLTAWVDKPRSPGRSAPGQKDPPPMTEKRSP